MVNRIKKISILIFSLSLLFLTTPVFATTNIIELAGSQSIVELQDENGICQGFQVRDDFIVEIDIMARIDDYATSTSNLDFLLCKGSLPSNSTYTVKGVSPNTYLGCYGQGIEIEKQTLTNIAISSELRKYKINMSESHATEIGDIYYFCLRPAVENFEEMIYGIYDPYILHEQANEVLVDDTGTVYTANGNSQLAYINYDVIDSVDYDFTEDYYYLETDQTDWYTIFSNTCILDEGCNLEIYYNELAIDLDYYLVYDNGQSITEGNAIATSTITYSDYFSNTLSIPDFGATSTEPYCIVMKDSTYYNPITESYEIGDIQKCGQSINWTTYDEYTDNLDFLNLDNICDDIATTSELWYNTQCGFRKTIAWFFYPSQNSLSFLVTNIRSFENSFPFRLLFAPLNAITDTIENSETEGGSFGLPSIDRETNEYIMIEGIDKDTIYETMGTSTVAIINHEVNRFLWLGTLILIMFIIVKFAI